MRKIAGREKVFLSAGVLVVFGILVYFVLLPMLQKDRPGSKASLQEIREKLESMEKLGSMAPMVAELENRMKSQSGYKDLGFKRGIADSMIIKYVAQAASQAGINELEQLDPKPDTSKKSTTEAKADQAILASVVDRLYLDNVTKQMKETGNPVAEEPQSVNSGQNPSGKDDSKNKEAGKSQDNESEKPGVSKKAERASEDNKQAELKKLIFPPVPKDVPAEAKQAMAKSLEARQGKTPTEADIDGILNDAGLKDEREKERVKNLLKLYSDRVKEAKSEMQQLINKLGIIQGSKKGEKIEKYSVKVVFKSQMEQLVRFLYNLQNTARWIRVDSMQISVADRKQTLLSVEISMTASVLYD